MSRLSRWGLVVVVGLYFGGHCRAQESLPAPGVEQGVLESGNRARGSNFGTGFDKLDLQVVPGSPAESPAIREIFKDLPQGRSLRSGRIPKVRSTPAGSGNVRIIIGEEEEPLLGAPADAAESPFQSGRGRVSPVDELGLSQSDRSCGTDFANPLQVANAQRQQLIDSLQALQDTYCRNAQLDEALAVRNMIRQLKQQAAQAKSLPEPVVATTATPAPESVDVRSLRGQNDMIFYRKVTGTVGEYAWGGDGNVYTDDSSLSSAAVHAGVLKEGETAMVRLTILPGRDSYPGISRNGVTSRPWQSWGGSYRIDGAAVEGTTVFGMRGQDKPPFAVYVIGSLSGVVYGTGSYTDDSDLGIAAVHAGLLKPGEAGFVMVTLEGGKSSYEASTQNGVTTSPYGSWGGGFRLSKFELPAVPAKELLLQPGFQLDVL